MSARDKILLLFLPGLVLLMGYAAFFLGGKNRTLGKLEVAAVAARAKSPPPAQAQVKQAAIAKSQKELEELTLENKELTYKWETLVKPCQVHERRADRLTRLIDLLHECGLEVTHHSLASASVNQDRDLALSGPQKRMEKHLESKEKRKPELWRIQVTGRFSDLVNTLHALGQGDTIAIPLGISMKQAEGVSIYHEWDLLLWI